MTDTRKRSTNETGGEDGTALAAALASLLEPIAVLAVSRGLPFTAVEDLLKAAFVETARRAQPESAGQRIVSRVATATGLTRREVTRLLDAPRGLPPPRPSPATQVFTRWRADPALRDKRGNVVALRRQGPAPSFEALARSITQDVHPRSLLEELCRLGLAVEEGDKVTLVRDSVVASRGSDRAYQFLAGNVGDHLRAGVANVLADEPPHVEQAVFADGLSAESMAAFHEIAKAQWQAVLAASVPALQALVDADAAAGRTADRRVRIGLYTYHDATAEAPESPSRAAGASRTARHRAPPKDR
ncbi:MAG TPA: DUF6502 family protein [Caldimonas sp.]|nr:DUF6502 family protein [Caldimonas sp.]